MLILRCEAVNGHRYELGSADTENESTARARAARVASFLSRVGNPARWSGGRVSIFDRGTERLIAVVRITPRKTSNS